MESVEYTKDIKRSQCKPPIDSFWSFGLMNRDNNFHTLQSRAFWLCYQLTVYSYEWDKWYCRQKKICD